MPLLLLSTPSIMKLLFRGRCPPTEGPDPTPTPPAVDTPALSSERLSTPLPVPPVLAIGRSSACFASNVVCTCAVVVSNAGGAPDTSTEVTAPCTSSVICSVLILFNSTRKLLIVVVEKFGAEAATLYAPTGKLLNRYSPFCPALVCALTPVFALVASTVAPGTTAPVLSRTVPTRSPLITCALLPEIINIPSSAAKLKTSANVLYIIVTTPPLSPQILFNLLAATDGEIQFAVFSEGSGQNAPSGIPLWDGCNPLSTWA